MVQGLTDVLSTLSQVLPTWAMALLIGALGIAFFPVWVRSVRAKQLKGRIRTAAHHPPGPERSALVEEAFAMAGDRPLRLEIVTEMALKAGMHDVAQRGLHGLEQNGGLEIAAGIRRRLEVARGPRRHPLETVARVNGLLEHGILELAREELEAALEHYPHDADLRDLAEQMGIDSSVG